MPSNVRDKVVFASPKNIEERAQLAGLCALNLGIEFPALVDDFQNSTERAYKGWPDRLYVIDREGRIAFKGAPGPYGFRPEEVARTLERLILASSL